MKRIVCAVAILGLATGCNILGGRDAPDAKTIGKRIPVLTTETTLEVDPALAGAPVSVPVPVVNVAWAQAGGNAANDLAHVALPAALSRAWSVSIGSGSSSKARLASEPVVADGKVFTIDTRAVVRAFDARTGGRVWETAVRGEGASEEVLFGGGVGYDEGRVFVTNGAGYAAALDASNGSVQWLVRPGGPLRGAPTIANDNVYIVSQDNQLYALNPADGSTRWSEAGAVETAGVFGSAAPAAAQGSVVAGFSSGELNAYRYENGRGLWQDTLSRTSISTSVASLSDIDADPVIAGGVVYAIGQGGRMVAVELNTGQRQWELNIAGIAMPWVAGEWIFVVTDQAQLLAVARSNGRVRWMTQLPRWRDEEDKKGPIQWVGPVLAGGRLLLANSRGALVSVSPEDGSVQQTIDTGEAVTLPPVVAGNTLYLLHDNGQLSAWR
jgi:outer membrane protein assembly factor BamB